MEIESKETLHNPQIINVDLVSEWESCSQGEDHNCIKIRNIIRNEAGEKSDDIEKGIV